MTELTHRVWQLQFELVRKFWQPPPFFCRSPTFVCVRVRVHDCVHGRGRALAFARVFGLAFDSATVGVSRPIGGLCCVTLLFVCGTVEEV